MSALLTDSPHSDVRDRRLSRRSALVIDGASGALAPFHSALITIGFEVVSAIGSGDAQAALAGQYFDFSLIALTPSHSVGLNLARLAALHGSRALLLNDDPWGPAELAAASAGDVTLVTTPLCVAALLDVMRNCLQRASSHAPIAAPAFGSARESVPPRSVSERWAVLVLKGCRSDGDLRTLGDWAAHVGISYSGLRALCRILDIAPHDARDFARALRALVMALSLECDPIALVDVGDLRTLKTFLERAGPAFSKGGSGSIDAFLATQRFVRSSHAGVRLLAGHFSAAAGTDGDRARRHEAPTAEPRLPVADPMARPG